MAAFNRSEFSISKHEHLDSVEQMALQDPTADTAPHTDTKGGQAPSLPVGGQGLTGASSATTPVTLESLQQAMAGIPNPASASETPTVADLVHPDVLGPALTNAASSADLSSLVALLPEDERSNEGALMEILRSPALKTQAAALTSALASGAGAELLTSFGMPTDPASAAPGVAGLQAFLRSLKRMQDENGPSS